jgi:glycosyltransferase involved in cell wall biosynthesis
MIEMNNGADPNGIGVSVPRIPDSTTFRMATAGTLYPYHGYDRILQGLADCNEIVDGIPVEFHIVGESQTIDELDRLSNRLGLQRVYFHGRKDAATLNDLFRNYHVGLGCLALHRRHANVDTALKIIEYWMRGLPCVTSGVVPLKHFAETVITVPDDEAAVDISSIFHAYRSIEEKTLENLADYSRQAFCWKNIMKEVLEKASLRSSRESK